MTNLLSSRQAMNTSFDPLRLVNTYGAFGRYVCVVGESGAGGGGRGRGHSEGEGGGMRVCLYMCVCVCLCVCICM